MNQPSDDTPSVTPVGRDSSLREGAGNAIVWPGAIHRTARKPQRCGRFSSPLRNSKDFGFYHSSGDTPSVTPVGRDSSLREGAGERSHSTGCSLKSGVAGDFHRPYETQKILAFTIHRGTLPQSRPLGVTAPSEREPENVPETQLPCHQSNVSRVVVYSWQVTPDLSPVMGRGLADRAFSRRSAAWGRQMWRRSMASAFRMLWGLA